MNDAPANDPAEALRRVVLDDPKAATRSLLKTVGPRLLRDILGPTLTFYVAWKLTGNIIIGIALGTAFSLACYGYERLHGRPGMIARVVLAFVVVQAVVGLVTDSATAYLIQPAILGAINGAVWLGSVAIHRPLAGIFAREVFPVDDETRSSPEFRAVFRYVSLVFGLFFVVFAAVQAVVLVIVGVGAYVVLRVLEVAFTLVLIVYCLHYVQRRLGPQLRLTRG
jgi:intracellular septation protein A